MALKKELLEMLACPSCKGRLTPTEDEQGLLCKSCHVVFPVKDEIPVMLMAEAIPADKWEDQKE